MLHRRRGSIPLGLALCAGLFLGSTAVGQTISYVDAANCPGPGDGSADNPFCEIQTAINAAAPSATPPDEIIVADGVYTGAGNKNLDFGGKIIKLRSASDDPSACIIDCEGDGRGFYFHSGETAEAEVKGFTIRNGYVTSSSPGMGAGGGVYCSSSSPTLTDCEIVANKVISTYSTSQANGGGVYCSGSDPTLVNCTLSANTVSSLRSARGGAFYCRNSSSPILVNCTITGNTASGNFTSTGGGLYCSASTPSLANCILWGDTPQEIYVDSGTPVATYCDIQGGFTGTGNIDVVPGFAFTDDFHLLAGSPCIDAGTNSPAGGLPSQDADGNPRPLDGDASGEATADMGAYEFNPAIPSLAITPRRFVVFVSEGEISPEPMTLSIRNAGGGTLHWTLDWEGSWLQADSLQGESTGEVDDVALIADATTLSHGVYSTTVLVSDPLAVNDPQTVEVVLYVIWTLHVPSEYATIQSAIDAAEGVGDRVVIADGIYTGPGNKNLDFGGKPITVRSASGDPNACIIDCEGDGRGFYFHSGETVESVVQGLTIRNGFVIDDTLGGSDGGGALCVDSSPTMTNCVFSGNTAFDLSITSSGGGHILFRRLLQADLDRLQTRQELSGRGRRHLLRFFCRPGAEYLLDRRQLRLRWRRRSLLFGQPKVDRVQSER